MDEKENDDMEVEELDEVVSENEKKLMEKALIVLFEMLNMRNMRLDDFNGIDELIAKLQNGEPMHSMKIRDTAGNDLNLIFLFPFFNSFKNYSKDQKKKIHKLLFPKDAPSTPLLIIAGPIVSKLEKTTLVVEKNVKEVIEQEQRDYEVFTFRFFLTYPFAYECVQQNGALFTEKSNVFPTYNIKIHKIYENGKLKQRYVHRPICKDAVAYRQKENTWISSEDLPNVSSSNIKTLDDTEIDACVCEEVTHDNRIVLFFSGVEASISHLSINGNFYTRAQEFELITKDEIHGEFLMLHINGSDFAIENYLHSEIPHVIEEKELEDLQTRYPGILEPRKASIILTSDPRVRFMGWKFSQKKPTVICIPSNTKNKLQYRILKNKH